QVIRCRAAVAWAPGKPLSVEEVEVAPPKAGEVRIKIVATGICHSDEHALKGSLSNVEFPVIPGHEGAGIVESIGEGVTSVKPGDKVIPLCVPQCGKCSFCLNPESNFCQKSHIYEPQNLLPDKTSRFTCKGKQIHHFMWISTFAEYTVVPEYSVAKIDAAAPLDKVCLFGCGFSTGYGAAINTAKTTQEEHCISTILNTSTRHANKPLLVSHSNPLILKSRKSLTRDCHQYWSLSPDPHCNTTLPKQPSSHYSCFCFLLFLGWKMRECIPKLVSSYLEKKFNSDLLITHTLPLAKVNEGFELLRAGKR
ncbi:ADH1 dehydrogenase, partial [Pteruthius melanotis]|nr:ADH1 dehydrogenase [Pteruthius melanotis]